MDKLLTRDQFREQVFARDNHTCVFCDKPAVDAHHILERRLWPDGGYYLSNGASVCAEHHMACERTEISVEDVLAACKIKKRILPEHLYDDQIYDKWGNPVMPNGTRLRGELFEDESVQKVLVASLPLFVRYIKYPRTYHLPWSQNVPEDDRVMQSVAHFEGERVIITKKMDGENTTWYSDYNHARSIDGANHPSRNWAKALWAQKCGDIPEGHRICLENLYAQHSIPYDDLESYVYGFSYWDDKNVCQSWDDTLEWFELMEITPVEVLYDDIFDEAKIRNLHKSLDLTKCEGYVLRLAKPFHYSQFRKSVAKFVRKNHIQTVKHWMQGQPIVPNKLRK